MKKLLFISVFAFVILACSSPKTEFVGISKFNIQPGALKTEEPIRVLYSSPNLSPQEEGKFLMQIVVESQETGDTVNVLTLINLSFPSFNKDQPLVFFEENSEVYKMICAHTNKIERPNKVTSDSKFKGVLVNKFPTVFGGIGSFTKNKK